MWYDDDSRDWRQYDPDAPLGKVTLMGTPLLEPDPPRGPNNPNLGAIVAQAMMDVFTPERIRSLQSSALLKYLK